MKYITDICETLTDCKRKKSIQKCNLFYCFYCYPDKNTVALLNCQSMFPFVYGYEGFVSCSTLRLCCLYFLLTPMGTFLYFFCHRLQRAFNLEKHEARTNSFISSQPDRKLPPAFRRTPSNSTWTETTETKEFCCGERNLFKSKVVFYPSLLRRIYKMDGWWMRPKTLTDFSWCLLCEC